MTRLEAILNSMLKVSLKASVQIMLLLTKFMTVSQLERSLCEQRDMDRAYTDLCTKSCLSLIIKPLKTTAEFQISAGGQRSPGGTTSSVFIK